MTEMLHEPNESNVGTVHEILDTEQRAETYIQNVLLQGSQLAHQTFESEAAAQEAADAHIKACIRIAQSIQGLEQVDLMARGEGVQVANVQPVQDAEQGMMSFKVNADQPFASLSMFDERAFRYRGVVTGTVETDDNAWKVHTCIVGSESVRRRWDFNRTQFGFSMFQLELQSMIMIPTASEDVHIEVTPLELQRQHALALEELAMHDANQTGLVDDINKVHEAFLGETQYLIKFPEVALLRKIGSKGIQFGMQGDKQADALNTALIKAITPNRPVVVDGRMFVVGEDEKVVASHTAGFNGTVIDVISQIPTTDKNIGPTLVMMPLDGSPIHYAPLTNIKSLQF